MGTQTFRPGGFASGSCSSGLVVSGAATVWQALQDDSDSSYDELQYLYHDCSWLMVPKPGPWTLPQYAQVRSASVRARAGDTSGWGNYNYPNGTGLSFDIQLGTIGGSVNTYRVHGYSFGANPQPWPQGVISTIQFGSASFSPSDQVTQADLDGMVLRPTLARLGVIGPLTPAPRLYEVYVDVVYNLAPVITVTGPATPVTTTSRPIVTATYTDAELDAMDQYRVKVFTATQVAAIGFDPETAVAVWDSLPTTPATPIASGGGFSVPIAVDLTNNTTYVAYVKASDVGSSGRFGGWAAGSAFVVATTPPAAPSISSVVPDPVLNRVAVNLIGLDNELSRNQANGETSVLGWYPATNVAASQVFADGATTNASATMTSATAAFTGADVGISVTGAGIPASTFIKSINSATSVVLSQNATATATGVSITLGRQWPRRQTTQVLQSLAAFVMRSAASGTVTVRSVSATTTAAILKEAIPVRANSQYTALASFRQAAVAAGRTGRVDMAWYDSTGTIISTVTGSAVALTSTTWASQQSFITATSPANAAYLVLLLNVLGGTAANEDTYFDAVSGAPGSSTTWTRGGLAQPLSRGSDTFTRADSAVSMGTADVGGAWTSGRGTWGIQSNKAYHVSGTLGNIDFAYLTLPEFADGSVACDVTLSAVRTDAILFMRGRGLSSGNPVPDCVLAEVSVTSTLSQVNLGAFIGGASTSVQLATVGLVLGTTVGIKLECIGDRVNAYFDRKDGKGFIKAATLQLTATDMAALGSQPDSSIVGLGVQYAASFDDGTTKFDNFVADPLTASQQVIVERSADNGVTWQTVRTGYLTTLTDPGQYGTVYDYEAPRGAAVLWRAKVQATEGTDVLTGPYSASVSGLLATDGNAWLKSPSSAAINLPVHLLRDSVNSKSEEDMVIFEPLGRADPLIHGGTIRYEEFDGLDFFLPNDGVWRAFEALRARREPLLLQTCYGDQTINQYLRIPGSSGAYASAPDAPLLRLSTDFDIKVRASLDTVLPAAVQNLLAKWVATGNQRAWRVTVQVAGNIRFEMTTDGSTITGAGSSANPAWTNGVPLWLRITRVGTLLQFWTAPDSPIEPANSAFTKLGTDQTLAGTIFPTTAPLEVGSQDLGTNNRAIGNVYAFSIRNGIDAVVAADPFFDYQANVLGTGNVLVDKAGNVFTLNGAASIVTASGFDEQFWVRLGPSRVVSRLTMTTAPGQLRRVRIPARQVATPSVP